MTATRRQMLLSATTLVLVCITSVAGFSTPLFTPTAPKVAPSKTEGIDIELPHFPELFERIRQVSPLADLAMKGREGGFSAVDDKEYPHKWRTVEKNKQRLVHQIDKIDNFQKLNCPIVRFRSSLKGPCIGERFANFIMSLEERQKWDQQIADVQELHVIEDLDAARIAMGRGYGDCSRLGIGYCATKANLVASSREQLTMCGVQDFPDGSCLIWGTEMEDRHNHLLPQGERQVRAKSHLFSTALMPTGPDSFDVEYVLQMDMGGIPAFLGTPVLIDTVKSLFRHAKEYFSGGEDSAIAKYLTEQQQMANGICLFEERKGLLLAP